jgi:hypothetical protein
MNELRPGVLGAPGRTIRRSFGTKLAPAPKDDPMDMNELFYHHQMALIALSQPQGRGASARHASFDLPGHYAQRIDAYRAKRGMRQYFTGPPHSETPKIG